MLKRKRGLRKVSAWMLTLLLIFSSLPIQSVSAAVEYQPIQLGDYEVITENTTITEDTAYQKTVVVPPGVTLTVEHGVTVNMHNHIVIYGKVSNTGTIFMNGTGVYANYVNMGGIVMSGDNEYLHYGRFDPYGYTTNVGPLEVGLDAYPKAPIHINTPEEVVTESSYILKGKTIPGFTVIINGEHMVTADSKGDFEWSTTLSTGENFFTVLAKDVFQREGNFTEVKVILDESTLPPPNAPSVEPLTNKQEYVKGSSEPQATIFVHKDGSELAQGVADEMGNFSIFIGKQLPQTSLSITAKDTRGKVSEATILVVSEVEDLKVLSSQPGQDEKVGLFNKQITIKLNKSNLEEGPNFQAIKLADHQGVIIPTQKNVMGDTLAITFEEKLEVDSTYTVTVPAESIIGQEGAILPEEYTLTFQTIAGKEVSGGIYEDTKWEKGSGPYYVTSDLVVFPDATLTIEPGVSVFFMPNTGLTIRGKLTATGTEQERVLFSSENKLTKSDWKGLKVDTSLGGSIELEYAEVSNASTGIYLECCGPYREDTTTVLQVASTLFNNNETAIHNSDYYRENYKYFVRDSRFQGNTYGLKGLFSTISGSTFEENSYAAMLGGNSTVYNNTFFNNGYGVYNATGVNLFKNEFKYNEVGIDIHSGKISYNNVLDNKTGIQSYSNVTIRKNVILQNDVGLKLNYQTSEPMEFNNFNNKNYDVMNYTKYEMNLSQNYWGSSDEQTIKNKIYDGYDDVEKGIVKFEPILTEGVSIEDRQPPVWKQNSYLNAYYNQVDGKSDITLTWRSAVDDMYVNAYRIYLDGQLIETVDSINDDEYYNYSYVIEDVSVGKHTLKLEAGDFEGNWSSQPLETEIEVWDQTAPVWPEESKIKITESNATSATIEWTPAIDNVGVSKYRILAGAYTWGEVEGSTTTFTISSLRPWEEYEVVIEAIDAAGNVSYSPFAKFTLEDNTPPKWPEGAELSVLDVKETSVELAWPEATDDFEVMYHLFVNGKEYAHLSQNPYTVTGLLPGTEYTFTVYATDGTQENEELSYKLTTPDKTAPTWETGSNISASNITETSLDLSWPAAKDNVGVTGYRIKQNGNVLQTVDNTTMSYKVTGLEANTMYYFEVEARDEAGNWSRSLADGIITIDQTPPTWKEGSVLTSTYNGEMEIGVTWPEASDNVGVAYYRILLDGTEVAIVRSFETSYMLTGLTTLKEYEITIEAQDTWGHWSTTSLSKKFTTVDKTGPSWDGDASLVFKNITETTVELSWPEATDNVGVTQYRLSMNGSVLKTFSSTENSYKVTGLSPKMPYEFHLVAMDQSGNWSMDGLHVAIGTSDSTPPSWGSGSSLTASDIGETSFTINWPKATDNVEVGGYRILLNGELVDAVGSAVYQYKLTGLTPLQEYTVTIQGKDTSGNWDTTGLSKKVSTVDKTGPYWDAMAILEVKNIDETSVELLWQAALDNVKVAQYRVSLNGNVIKTLTGNETSFKITGLKAKTTYEFQVEAADQSGNWSSGGGLILSASTIDQTAPAWNSESTLVVNDIGEDGFIVSWPAATDNVEVGGYRILLNGEPVDTVGSAVDQYKLTELIPLQEYTVKIQAKDTSGNWNTTGLSKKVSTVDKTKPYWTTMDALEVRNIEETTVELFWEKAQDNVKITQYQLILDGEVILSMNDLQQSYEVTGLESSKTYKFQVKALDSSGNWNISNEVTVQTKDETSPTWPSNSSVTTKKVSDNVLEITWPKATDNSTVDKYIVYQNNTELKTLAADQNKLEIKNLAYGKEYTYSVIAVDKTGNQSAKLAGSSITIKDTTPPTWPTTNEDYMVDEITETSISFRWVEATDENKIKEYILYVNGKENRKQAGAGIVLSGLKPGTNYQLKLEAVDTYGNKTNTGPSYSFYTKGVGRINGSSRYDTAATISKTGWDKAETVIIARGDSFPDALAGAPLAKKLNAPILLTDKGSLSYATKTEIKRLGAKKVIILGGPSAVENKVADELKAIGMTVERINGKDRFDTANQIAKKVGKNKKVVLAYGYNFPDALAIASYAASKGYPILLTDKNSIAASTKQLVKEYGTDQVLVVGGEGVISNQVLQSLSMNNIRRIAGSNRFETAAKIIETLTMKADSVYIANGNGFADALTGSVLAAKHNAPLLLVNSDSLPWATKRIITNNPGANYTILGGAAAVDQKVASEMAGLMR